MEEVGEEIDRVVTQHRSGVEVGQSAIKDTCDRPLTLKNTEQSADMSLSPALAQSLTEDALTLARLAGRRILEVYAGEYEVAIKEDETPVTTADMAAHDIIVKGLGELEPNFPVLSEESDFVPFETRHDWPLYWLVDPLDGTREFLRRNGEFSVNIALIAEGRPLLGVIFAPVLDVAYFATRGAGVFKQMGAGECVPIHVRNATDRLTVATSRCPTVGPNMQHFLDGIGEHDEISMGSALKSCLVAEGAADVYARLGPTGEWDTAAAQCIVEEAGGHITDTSLRGLRYNCRESLINPPFMVFGDDRVNWQQHLPDTLLR